MPYQYTIRSAGRQTDYSQFWHYFDNYIVTAAHHEYLDEQIMGWYLTDDYHQDFYNRIYGTNPSTTLLLFYRNEVIPLPKKRGTLSALMHARMKKGEQYLSRHMIRHAAGEGDFVGFCILERDRMYSSTAWILALCLSGLDDNAEKMTLWNQAEKELHESGIRELETASYQNYRFWDAAGFRKISNHVMIKKIVRL